MHFCGFRFAFAKCLRMLSVLFANPGPIARDPLGTFFALFRSLFAPFRSLVFTIVFKSKKMLKIMPKWSQNGANMEPKLMKNRCENVVEQLIEKNIKKTPKIDAKME